MHSKPPAARSHAPACMQLSHVQHAVQAPRHPPPPPPCPILHPTQRIAAPCHCASPSACTNTKPLHKPTGFGGDVNPEGILEFIDAGHNMILAAAPDASEPIRNLALEVGVDFDDKGTTVFDHFSYQAAGGADDSKLVVTSEVVDAPGILGAGPKVGVEWI